MRNIACLTLLVLAPACGGSSSTPDVPDAASTTQPCDHAAALCTKLDQCAPFFLKAIYGDVTGCTDRLTKTCIAQSLSDGSGMTESNIVACEAALTTATCDDVFANNLPACTFRGSYADGATCGDSSQCASGFCSHGSEVCGVCTAKGAAGAACPSGSNDECLTGLVCSSGHVCVAPAAVGGACDDATAPCLVGSFCTTAKTCALTVTVGQECPGGYLNLGDGTLCWAKSTAASPQLAAQIGTAGTGHACGLAPGNGLPATLCAPGGVAACTQTAGGISLFGIPTTGQCAALTPDGYQCNATSECFAGAQCIAGTCQIPSGRYCN